MSTSAAAAEREHPAVVGQQRTGRRVRREQEQGQPEDEHERPAPTPADWACTSPAGR